MSEEMERVGLAYDEELLADALLLNLKEAGGSQIPTQ